MATECLRPMAFGAHDRQLWGAIVDLNTVSILSSAARLQICIPVSSLRNKVTCNTHAMTSSAQNHLLLQDFDPSTA